MQLPTDLAKRLRGPSIRKDRRAADYGDAIRIDVAEDGDCLLRQTIREVFAVAVGAEVVERQHCNRHGCSAGARAERGCILDRRGKAIALSSDRRDKACRLGRIAERLPHFANGGVDTHVGVDEDVRAPQLADDVGAWHELVPPFDQHDQQFERPPFQVHRHAAAPQLKRRDVQLEVFSKAKHFS